MLPPDPPGPPRHARHLQTGGEIEGHPPVPGGRIDGLPGDGEGPADGNLRLSERRANAVLRAVSAFAGETDVILSAEGFGEIMPMACDDTAWGRQINRRVEVWVRDPKSQADR